MAEVAGHAGSGHGGPSSGGDSPSARYQRVDVKLLGEGTYGEVYKVKDTMTNEILAMKKMKFANIQITQKFYANNNYPCQSLS